MLALNAQPKPSMILEMIDRALGSDRSGQVRAGRYLYTISSGSESEGGFYLRRSDFNTGME